MSRTPLMFALTMLAASVAAAGNLNPPVGPVSPTLKTLKQVEPRQHVTFEDTPGDADSVHVLDRPGSYYLVSNLYVPGGKNGIKIAAPNVTLDLNGFAILDLGQAAGPALSGIVSLSSGGAPVDLTIRNGTISGCLRGVFIPSSDGSRVEGITCSGQVNEAFFIGAASTVTGCIARGAGTGFLLGDGSRAEGCTAAGCSGDGFNLIYRASAEGCTSRSNQGDGFESGAQGYLINCRADNNLGNNGFNFAGSGCTAIDCTANGNSFAGFHLGTRGSATRCAAGDNGTAGFYTSHYCAVTDCTATGNPIGYYIFGSRCRVVGNTAAAAGGTGIKVFGSSVIIRENAVVQSDTGIHLDGNFYCTVIGNHINDSANEIDDEGSGNNVAALVSIADAAGPHANFVE